MIIRKTVLAVAFASLAVACGGSTPPAEEPSTAEAAPAEGEAAPAEGEAAPAEGEAAPAEGEAAPEAPPAE